MWPFLEHERGGAEVCFFCTVARHMHSKGKLCSLVMPNDLEEAGAVQALLARSHKYERPEEWVFTAHRLANYSLAGFECNKESLVEPLCAAGRRGSVAACSLFGRSAARCAALGGEQGNKDGIGGDSRVASYRWCAALRSKRCARSGERGARRGRCRTSDSRCAAARFGRCAGSGQRDRGKNALIPCLRSRGE